MGREISSKQKPWNKAFLFGALSLALYGALYVYQEAIVDLFGRGGTFAFLPISAAFLFSYIHGSFTGSFWSVIGIEASKKKEAH